MTAIKHTQRQQPPQQPQAPETLTDTQREALDARAPWALRIIDADAADRAALVAQHEADLQATHREYDRSTAALVAQLEAARAALVEAQTVGVFCSGDEDERPRLRAQVTRLTRERDEARAEVEHLRTDLCDLESLRQTEVTRLTRERVQLTEAIEAIRARAAEDRLALRAEVARLTEAKREHEQRWLAAEARVSELEALLTTAEAESRAQRQRADDWETIAARDFQLAANWKERFEAAEVDAAVAKDRLAALRARAERAVAAIRITNPKLADLLQKDLVSGE